MSPTASLLRTSRLFSLPPPLPRPIVELGNAPNSGSATATLPYPVQATIETSERALPRGDWGLKRPLPLKSTTKPSKPCVKIDNIDSIDHITDFGSASAYSRTLEKWQETDLSFSTFTSDQNRALKSVFEPEEDNTVKQHKDLASNERWKFEGPWLGTQTDQDFLIYFDKRVKGRRTEFRQYLRKNLPRERLAQQRKHLREQGEAEDDTLALETTSKSMSEEQIELEIKQLRSQPGRLENYIRDFLDLPKERRDASTDHIVQPPSTHPSAGLSYQRSHSHSINHPVHGPQVFKPPVMARVLAPQRDSRGKDNQQAVLGLGGIACLDNERPFSSKDSLGRKVANLDPDLPGGAKTWVSLRKAMVNPDGRIEIVTSKADNPSMDASGTYDTHNYSKNTATRPLAAHGSTRSYGLDDMGQSPTSTAASFQGGGHLLRTINQSLADSAAKKNSL